MKANLPYLAALRGLGALDAESIKSAIDSLMNEGFYTDECLDALDSEPARLDEVLPAFTAALAHYGIIVPDRELAVWQLIEHHLRGAISSDGDPWQSLCDLIRDVYWRYDFHSKTTQYLGDSHGIQHLVGIYWEVDDEVAETALPLGASIKPDEQHLLAIRREAEQWVFSYGGKHAA